MARKKYIYEVRITLPKSVAKNYRIWLLDHIDDMLSLSYFNHAQLWEGDSLDIPDMAVFKVHYSLATATSLQDYLQHAAPQMRSRLPEEFTGQLQFHRALLTEFI